MNRIDHGWLGLWKFGAKSIYLKSWFCKEETKELLEVRRSSLKHMSHEPRKPKASYYFPLYWLVNGDPYNGWFIKIPI